MITQDLSRLAERAGRASEGVDVSFTTEDAKLRAIDDAAARDGFPRRFEAMKTHLRVGGRIAVAEYDSVPIAWLMHRRGRQDTYKWLHLVGDDRSVFGYGLYTVRGWRRRGLASLLDGYCAKTYLAEGCRLNCAVMERGARTSLRYHQWTEHRFVGFIWRMRLSGGLMFVHCDQSTRFGKFDATNPFVYRFPHAR